MTTSTQELTLEPYKISQFGEPYLYSINRQTFEQKPASSILQSLFDNTLFEKDTLYIVLGTDSGLLVDKVLEAGVPYGSKYIFIELPEVIYAMDAQLTFTKWDDSVEVCTAEKFQEVAEEFKIQSFLFTEKVKYLKSVGANDGFNNTYFTVDSELSLTLESLKHQTMVSLSRKPFFKRQIENFSENHTPASLLVDAFTGQSCIILGGGPSLEEQVDWLKNNQERIVIIAVSRVIKKLIKEGITPDIVVSVDPHDISFDVSRDLLYLPPETIFLHSNYVVPSLLSQWQGRSLYYQTRIPWLSDLNIDNINLAGPTVTNAAIGAAIDFGFKQILLSGVDLCFAADGSTHAKGNNEEKTGPMLGFKGQWVENYEGNLAETTNSFLHASYIINTQAQQAAEKQSQIINLSSKATKIEYIPFKEINSIALDSSEKKQTTLSTFNFPSAKDLVVENKKLLKELDKFQKSVVEVEKIAKQALSDNHDLYKANNKPERSYAIKQRIDKAEKKLDQRYEQASLFIKKFGIKHFIKTVRTDTDQDWSNEEMEEVGQLYYQAFVDTIDEIKPLLNHAKDRIKNRTKEFDTKGNILDAIKQWQQDKQFGRALLFKNNNPSIIADLPLQVQEQLDDCINQHHIIMNNEDTAHLRRSKKLSSLNGVERKIVYLFNQNKNDALLKLADSLALIDNKDNEAQAKKLHILAKAYWASLTEQPQLAIDLFKQVDDSLQAEDEWLQISALAINLNLFDDAEQYLKKLSDSSERYTPKYASILKLNNKVADAFNIYINYLETNPNDTQSWIALGKLCLEQNSEEHAEVAFQQVLSQDPENIEAKHFINQLKNSK